MEQILGVGIGIATVCLLLSIIASHVQEVTAAFTSRRAATLELALQKMLEDQTLYGMFASHPLIQNISFHPIYLVPTKIQYVPVHISIVF